MAPRLRVPRQVAGRRLRTSVLGSRRVGRPCCGLPVRRWKREDEDGAGEHERGGGAERGQVAKGRNPPAEQATRTAREGAEGRVDAEGLRGDRAAPGG